MNMRTTLLLSSTLMLLSACASTIHKLEGIGQQPPLTNVENPQTKVGYQPITWPLPEPEAASARTANSLWQPGGRAFFRDQRASRVGDILRVNIDIKDTAKIDSKTQRSRTASETAGAPSLFGLETKIGKLLPLTGAKTDPTSLLNVSGDTTSDGSGIVDRKDTITTQVAALVTQVLPNGNLVIEGTQEVLVNYEIREISVKGVIRPQDINSDNTIESNQVAQARIVYSGRGNITDIQQPRWGQQAIEVLSPF
jgi:flagellar L-ring protein precursor FlgH